MIQNIDDPTGFKKSNSTLSQSIVRYPLFLDAISIVFFKVIDGILKGKPIHMSLGYSSMIKDTDVLIDLSVQGIHNRLSRYTIIYSNSDVSSNFVRLRHPQNMDIFEPGEFLCSCRSGFYHFRFSSEGALEETFSEFNGYTPEFICQLIEDFPNDNFQPKGKLLEEINNNGLIDYSTFLDGLNPRPPIEIEVD
jgi:hypothetical protein